MGPNEEKQCTLHSSAGLGFINLWVRQIESEKQNSPRVLSAGFRRVFFSSSCTRRKIITPTGDDNEYTNNVFCVFFSRQTATFLTPCSQQPSLRVER